MNSIISKLDADKHHANAHAGIQRNFVDGIGLAAETGKGRARIGEGVYANAEPSHAIAAGNSQDAEEENDEDAKRVHVQQHAEVEHDDHGDEALQEQEELALGDEIGFAGFVDQLGDLAHGAVHGQVLQPLIDGQAEEQAENTKQDAEEQELMAVDAKKGHLREVRQLEIGLAACFGRLRPGRGGTQRQHRKRSGDLQKAPQRPANFGSLHQQPAGPRGKQPDPSH